MTPILLTGIQPTGSVHLGNYFGVIEQCIALQGSYQLYLMVADLHALNQVHDPAALRANIWETVLTYLSCGVDAERAVLFQQSAVPAHAELAAILGAQTSLGLLERAHAYKDALANGKESNLGLFSYPVLMASDILLYQPDGVPVGKDQQQHLEIASDLLNRFNFRYGHTFSEPKQLILEDRGVIPGTDGRKMSKSYDNVIGLFDAEATVAKKISRIVTDSKGPTEPKDPDTDTLFALHRLVATPDELFQLDREYRSGAISYKTSKDLLAERVIRFLRPIQARRAALEQNPEHVLEVLSIGAAKANQVANETLSLVKERAGLRLTL